MAQEQKEPLVPPEVDLRDFPFMALDVRRLRDSRLATMASGEEFRAAVLLWCAAWHQTPAGSVPDDDIELVQLAGYGRDLKTWRKVKANALHGWVKCSDGRLYHPVVAEKALEAWAKKSAQRDRTRRATEERERRRREAQERRDGARDEPPDDERNHQRYVDADEPRNDARNVVHRDRDRESTGRSTTTACSSTTKGARADPLAELRIAMTRLWDGAGYAALPPDTGHAAVWLGRGYDPKMILDVLVSRLAGRKKPPGSWRYFDDAMAEEHDKRVSSGETPRPERELTPEEVERSQRLKARMFFNEEWRVQWPGKPGDPDCDIPEHILTEEAAKLGKQWPPEQRAHH
jgi:hypothetical protein